MKKTRWAEIRNGVRDTKKEWRGRSQKRIKKNSVGGAKLVGWAVLKNGRWS